MRRNETKFQAFNGFINQKCLAHNAILGYILWSNVRILSWGHNHYHWSWVGHILCNFT